KNYSSPAEETRRREIFEKNAKLIAAHNFFYAVGMISYFMDVNQFSDMTSEEWLSLYTSPLPDYTNTGNESTFLPPENFIAAPTVDWRRKGYVTPVKHQGGCGSCWAFSSTGSLEGQHYKKTGTLVSLSEQQLVDCSRSYGNHGCSGGFVNLAFDYIKRAGGIEGESDYPYRGLVRNQFTKYVVVPCLDRAILDRAEKRPNMLTLKVESRGVSGWVRLFPKGLLAREELVGQRLGPGGIHLDGPQQGKHVRHREFSHISA
ncbi:CATL-like protein, partial [Mya arenaria]